MEINDITGKTIIPPFLQPCPKECGLTGGCDFCRSSDSNKHEGTQLPIGKFPFQIVVNPD